MTEPDEQEVGRIAHYLRSQHYFPDDTDATDIARWHLAQRAADLAEIDQLRAQADLFRGRAAEMTDDNVKLRVRIAELEREAQENHETELATQRVLLDRAEAAEAELMKIRNLMGGDDPGHGWPILQRIWRIVDQAIRRNAEPDGAKAEGG